jgi:hypothetical protein
LKKNFWKKIFLFLALLPKTGNKRNYLRFEDNGKFEVENILWHMVIVGAQRVSFGRNKFKHKKNLIHV